jgi:hypothetical protein
MPVIGPANHNRTSPVCSFVHAELDSDTCKSRVILFITVSESRAEWDYAAESRLPHAHPLMFDGYLVFYS